MQSGKKKRPQFNVDLDDTMENCTPGERKAGGGDYGDLMNEYNKNQTITDSIDESTLLRPRNMNHENSPDNSLLQSSMWIKDKL